MPKTAMANPWLERPPTRSAGVRLFCFHHAGGSALFFRDWQRHLPGLELYAVQLPGRGRRLSEPLLTSLTDIAAAALAGIADRCDRPFALFGHSMGAFVAFEIARRLDADSADRLRCLFVSGAASPHHLDPSRRSGRFSDQELLAELRQLDGTPDALVDSPELLDLLLPIVRADFQAVHDYRYVPGPPLHCPLVAFGGADDDEVTREQLLGWRDHTTGAFAASVLSGGHFFVTTHLERIAADVSRLLGADPTRRDASRQATV